LGKLPVYTDGAVPLPNRPISVETDSIELVSLRAVRPCFALPILLSAVVHLLTLTACALLAVVAIELMTVLAVDLARMLMSSMPHAVIVVLRGRSPG